MSGLFVAALASISAICVWFSSRTRGLDFYSSVSRSFLRPQLISTVLDGFSVGRYRRVRHLVCHVVMTSACVRVWYVACLGNRTTIRSTNMTAPDFHSKFFHLRRIWRVRRRESTREAEHSDGRPTQGIQRRIFHAANSVYHRADHQQLLPSSTGVSVLGNILYRSRRNSPPDFLMGRRTPFYHPSDF